MIQRAGKSRFRPARGKFVDHVSGVIGLEDVVRIVDREPKWPDERAGKSGPDRTGGEFVNVVGVVIALKKIARTIKGQPGRKTKSGRNKDRLGPCRREFIDRIGRSVRLIDVARSIYAEANGINSGSKRAPPSARGVFDDEAMTFVREIEIAHCVEGEALRKTQSIRVYAARRGRIEAVDEVLAIICHQEITAPIESDPARISGPHTGNGELCFHTARRELVKDAGAVHFVEITRAVESQSLGNV